MKAKVANGAWRGGLGGYYFDDLIAVRRGAKRDGMLYGGTPVTSGHDSVRNPGRSILIALLDDDGCIGFGDGAAIQYSGVVGRDPVLDPELHGRQVDVAVNELVEAGQLGFREACSSIEALVEDRTGERLHTGVQYGMSQAMLALIANHNKCSMAQVICSEWGAGSPGEVAIFAQCGEDRYGNVDKMILKRADELPHGLINNPSLFGREGTNMLDYAGWVRDRVLQIGEEEYLPTLHFDVYGMPGSEFGGSLDKITAFCQELERRCLPFRVRLEAPIDGGSPGDTATRMGALRRKLREHGIRVDLVADDWCNTIGDVSIFLEHEAADMIQLKTPDLGTIARTVDAAVLCQKARTMVFLGGTCNETDVSSRVSVHVAASLQADLMYAKPGMGVDEAMMVVRNEQNRLLMQERMLGGASEI